MKTLSLLTAVLLGISMNAIAAQDQDRHTGAGHHADIIYLADATQMNETAKKAKRHNFISRRAAKSTAVDEKDAYNADDDWTGATYVDEGNLKAKKRVNRQFRSRRAHTDYQFD